MRTSAVLSFLALVAACGGGGHAQAPTGASPGTSAGPPGADLPAIRGPAGHIRLLTLTGQPTTLAAYGSRVTVVALWATYCAPCLEELPYLEALYQKYRGRPDVSIIAVNLDDTSEPSMRDEVRGLLDQMAIEMPCLLQGEPVMELLTARDQSGQPRMALPLLAVVDPAFRIHRQFGFRRGMPRDEYLAEKSALVEAALRGDEPDDSSPPAQTPTSY